MNFIGYKIHNFKGKIYATLKTNILRRQKQKETKWYMTTAYKIDVKIKGNKIENGPQKIEIQSWRKNTYAVCTYTFNQIHTHSEPK